MDDYLTRVAEAVRDATLKDAGFQIGRLEESPMRDGIDLPSVIASVPRPEPVAWVATYTEDGTSRVIFAGDSDLAGLHEHPDCWGLKPLYADAVAAQPAVPGGLLTAADMKHLRRFAECAEDMDAGGHDVPKEAMKRLERAGAVRSLGFGRHETTAFGDAMLAAAPEAPQPVLDRPASIGGTTFGVGIPVRTLVAAAQRRYEVEQTPASLADRQALIDALRRPVVDAELTTLREQNAALVAALIDETDAAEALMNWCVKNVHKWNFPEHDTLHRAVENRRAALACVKGGAQ